jgi:hypothetical protein
MSRYIFLVVCLRISNVKSTFFLILLDIFANSGQNEPTTVEHQLMARVSRKVQDKRVLKLIGKYLRAGVMINGRLHETRKGVPQGRRSAVTHAQQYPSG